MPEKGGNRHETEPDPGGWGYRGVAGWAQLVFLWVSQTHFGPIPGPRLTSRDRRGRMVEAARKSASWSQKSEADGRSQGQRDRRRVGDT